MIEPTGCAGCCVRGETYCDRCDLLAGLHGLHVVGVAADDGGGGGLRVTVESRGVDNDRSHAITVSTGTGAALATRDAQLVTEQVTAVPGTAPERRALAVNQGAHRALAQFGEPL